MLPLKLFHRNTLAVPVEIEIVSFMSRVIEKLQSLDLLQYAVLMNQKRI